MKRVFIVHRWDGRPDDDWYPWLKGELEKSGFEVFVPAMPETERPQIEKWVPTLAKAVGRVDEETYFVGHSVGCQTIIRYLETLKHESKIGGAIFVAGWFSLNVETDEEREIAKPWLERKVDFSKVNQTTDNFVAIFSDSDPYVPKENEAFFRDNLHARTIMLSQRGHFTKGDGVSELPEVVDELLDMMD